MNDLKDYDSKEEAYQYLSLKSSEVDKKEMFYILRRLDALIGLIKYTDSVYRIIFDVSDLTGLIVSGHLKLTPNMGIFNIKFEEVIKCLSYIKVYLSGKTFITEHDRTIMIDSISKLLN